MEELLEPCPHCAGAVHITEIERDDNDRAPRPHRVYQIDCCAVMEEMSDDWWSGSSPPPETNCDRAARARLVEAWNRRAAIPRYSTE